MQRRHQRSKRSGRKDDFPDKPPPAREPSANPRRRRWLFRVAALTVVPVILIGGLELVLRVIGYGYPTDFFLKTRVNGRTVYIENQRFGFRFFPPAVARSPSPVVMEAEKAANTYRIFLLGESAAV